MIANVSDFFLNSAQSHGPERMALNRDATEGDMEL